MEQTFVSKPTPLLEKGKLVARGYSTHMNFIYDKKEVRSPALKEWDFYQIVSGDVVMQLTLGHISHLTQVSANIFNIQTGEKRSLSQTVLGCRKLKKSLSVNPEQPQVLQWLGKRLKVQVETTASYRRLIISEYEKGCIRSEADLLLTNSSFDKEKMVIATPFEKPNQFYLNYKENCFAVNGFFRIADMELHVRNGNGVLDWGRGVWPRKHEWVWGNGSTYVDGKHFGFNIGWGFGDTSQATENMFFLDNKAYKLGVVEETPVGENFRYADKEHNFVFNVTKLYDNFTQTKAVIVNNSCHQVFGLWKGYVKLPDGTKVEIPPFVAFCEHAKNNW